MNSSPGLSGGGNSRTYCRTFSITSPSGPAATGFSRGMLNVSIDLSR